MADKRKDFRGLNKMSDTVSADGPRHRAGGHRQGEAAVLYAPDGGRKYLNRTERARLLAAAFGLSEHRRLFALTIAWTGARVSEVLSLTRASLQVESGIVAIRTMKRRRHCVREVPIPPRLMAELDREFRITKTRGECGAQRLWAFSRVTAWRIIKTLMEESGIVGRQACPRGLRHGFAIAVLRAGIPITLAQRWLGHARLSTTAIYTAVCGPEEIALAQRFWADAGSPVTRPRTDES